MTIQTTNKDLRCTIAADNKRHRQHLLILSTLLLACIITSLAFGSVSVAIDDIWRILLFKTTSIKYGDWNFATEQIIWLIRTPRILFTVLVGGGLAITGAVMQAVVRNPMADPYILGLSSGASTGAALVLLSGISGYYLFWTVPFAAFLGALTAFSLVFFFARSGGEMSAGKLILAGIAVSYLFSAITSFLAYLASDQNLREVTHWLLGSVAAGKWSTICLPAILVPTGSLFLVCRARALNAISMGEETAVSLGLNSSQFRKQIFFVTALIVGVLVALSGSIGFVGLMIPHVVRLIVGNDHKKLLPLSFLTGAVFLVLADIIARVIISPIELPIGIITAICGAPFFIWLLQRKEGSS